MREVDPLIAWAYVFAAVFIGGIVMLSQGCGVAPLVEDAGATARVVRETVAHMDKDGSGVIDMQEIIKYCFAGWLAGRATETAGKMGLSKLKARKASASSLSAEQQSGP